MSNTFRDPEIFQQYTTQDLTSVWEMNAAAEHTPSISNLSALISTEILYEGKHHPEMKTETTV